MNLWIATFSSAITLAVLPGETVMSKTNLCESSSRNNAASDTIGRLFKLDELFPTYPRRKTARQLRDELSSQGFDCSMKTIYRDIDRLSLWRNITCDEESNKRHFFKPCVR